MGCVLGVMENPIFKASGSVLEDALEWYFRPKEIEKWQNGRIYEVMGIKHVQKAVLAFVGFVGIHPDGPQTNYFIGPKRTAEGLVKFEKSTRFNESVHASAVPMGVACIALLTALAKDYASPMIVPATLCVAGTFANAALAMLQRYNRTRIYTVLEHKRQTQIKNS